MIYAFFLFLFPFFLSSFLFASDERAVSTRSTSIDHARAIRRALFLAIKKRDKGRLEPSAKTYYARPTVSTFRRLEPRDYDRFAWNRVVEEFIIIDRSLIRKISVS